MSGQSEFKQVLLPEEAHDWFTVDNDDTVEFWACFQSRGYMYEAMEKFELENPGKSLELKESTLNLRFRVVDDAPAKNKEEVAEGVVSGGTA